MVIIVKMEMEVEFGLRSNVDETLSTAGIGFINSGTNDPYYALASRLLMSLARAVHEQGGVKLTAADRLIISLPSSQEAIVIDNPKALFGELLQIFDKT